MTQRLYRIELAGPGAARTVHVLSETDAQAADAAAPLAVAGEQILSIEEIEDDGTVVVDAPPAKTQAEESAPVTPGAAAVRTPS